MWAELQVFRERLAEATPPASAARVDEGASGLADDAQEAPEEGDAPVKMPPDLVAVVELLRGRIGALEESTGALLARSEAGAPQGPTLEEMKESLMTELASGPTFLANMDRNPPKWHRTPSCPATMPAALWQTKCGWGFDYCIEARRSYAPPPEGADLCERCFGKALRGVLAEA